MLFDEKYKESTDYDQFDFEDTKIMKMPTKNNCVFCRQKESNFIDISFQVPLCSEECTQSMWKAYQDEMQNDFIRNHMKRYEKEMQDELLFLENYKKATKDIIIVVHDQLKYLELTIKSIIKYTENYNLWIWDNNSGDQVQSYLKELMFNLNNKKNISCTVMRSDVNLGFIEPNNELAAIGESEYLILLNSDVEVFGGWDKALIGYLQNNQETKLTGYAGGLLDENGVGGRLGYGKEVDYIAGWCLCLSRETYEKHGLFNSELKFAYAEDSDLSMRIQSLGYNIHALHLLLVHHYENKTINKVSKEGKVNVRETFEHNHDKLRVIWKDYIENNRIDIRSRKKGEDAFNEIIGNFK